MKTVHTHYDNLKVARNAPIEVIRAAYKSLAVKYHPDKNPNDPEALRIMTVINSSYAVLSDPQKRTSHDVWISTEESANVRQDTSEREQQATAEPEIEFPPIVAGKCLLSELPKICQAKILERIGGRQADQLLLRLGGVRSSYWWAGGALFGFWLLFTTAGEYRWDTDATYFWAAITFICGLVLAYHAEKIYEWRAAPLKSFLIVTPLYIIRTYLDRLKYWPLHSVSDIKATHNYTNGSYQGTSVTISFDGNPYELSLSPELAYQSLLGHLNKASECTRRAAAQRDAKYFIDNDDFWEYRVSGIASRLYEAPSSSSWRRLTGRRTLTYFGATFLSATLMLWANRINGDRPLRASRTARTDAPLPTYRSSPPVTELDYVRPAAAPNGQPWPKTAGYVRGYQRLHGDGLSTVTVDNSQNDSDVFVKLVAFVGSNADPVRVFFIPSGGQFKTISIRKGRYDVRYRNLSTGTLQRSEPFDLEEVPAQDSVQYSNMTLTLYKVLNGNMKTYPIDEGEF